MYINQILKMRGPFYNECNFLIMPSSKIFYQVKIAICH